jgi:hypothetical protein
MSERQRKFGMHIQSIGLCRKHYVGQGCFTLGFLVGELQSLMRIANMPVLPKEILIQFSVDGCGLLTRGKILAKGIWIQSGFLSRVKNNSARNSGNMEVYVGKISRM